MKATTEDTEKPDFPCLPSLPWFKTVPRRTETVSAGKTVIIRADSSAGIGSGHIRRDLVLAGREFAGRRVLFATRELPGNSNGLIRAAGYGIVTLRSYEIKELIDVVRRHGAETVVIDHYGIDEKAERELKRKTGARLFVLDDTYTRHHCDILLNHNLYADPARYRGLVPEGCEVRCGARFTLLRREFIAARKERTGRRRDGCCKNGQSGFRALVIMGGVDHRQLNPAIIEVLEGISGLDTTIVTTSANPRLESLRGFVADRPRVTLRVDAADLARLMADADFAVITPSLAAHEALYLDLPLIAVQTADNQREMAAYLQSRGHFLLESFERRRFAALAAEMLDFLRLEPVDFVHLSEPEKELVRRWRNHPSISRWMLHQTPITPDQHQAFIAALKDNPERRYFLVKERGEGLGVIDFTAIDQARKSAAFGLYAAPGVRGAGPRLLRLVLDCGYRRLGLETLTAEVFSDNARALRLYRAFGFRESGADHESTAGRRRLHLTRTRM